MTYEFLNEKISIVFVRTILHENIFSRQWFYNIKQNILTNVKKIDEEVQSLKENCRNYDYDNKTCLSCERGFYKTKVQNKFLKEEAKLKVH